MPVPRRGFLWNSGPKSFHLQPILGSPHGEHGLKLAVFWCVCGWGGCLFFVFSEGSLQMR